MRGGANRRRPGRAHATRRAAASRPRPRLRCSSGFRTRIRQAVPRALTGPSSPRCAPYGAARFRPPRDRLRARPLARGEQVAQLYLASFRTTGFPRGLHARDRRAAGELLAPRWLRIAGYWYPRGGMPIDVFWQTARPPAALWIPDTAWPLPRTRLSGRSWRQRRCDVGRYGSDGMRRAHHLRDLCAGEAVADLHAAPPRPQRPCAGGRPEWARRAPRSARWCARWTCTPRS